MNYIKLVASTTPSPAVGRIWIQDINPTRLSQLSSFS